MDTRAVAALIGSEPRVLRRFLRSPASTFVAVGSGARYDFTEADVNAIRTRFAAWQSSSAAPASPQKAVAVIVVDHTTVTADDALVWAEEGAIELEDIRDPRVRARVRRVAKEQEDRLDMMLMAAGLHLTQIGDRRRAKAA